MKTLTREKGQRMWGGGEGGSGGGGGMNVNQLENMLSGYASQDWVDQNYLSIEFFSKLFKAYGPGEDEGDPDVEVVPNDLESTITNIKAMVGLWTEEYLSAMGLDPTEGGGGLSLNEPLASINNAGLASHPSSSGQTIIWNGSSWSYGTTGSGSVTYVGLVAPTGFTVSGSPITSMGTLTLSFASGYSLPLTADVNKGVTAYGWGDHAQAGYAMASSVYSKTDADARFLTISFFRSLFKAYTSGGSEVVPNSGSTATIDNIKAMFGFWTEQYVSAMGQDTSGSGNTLNEPLYSINNAGLASHPSSSGQTIIWNGSTWIYGTAGGGSGYYLPITGGTITGNLTISGKITTNGDVAIGDSGSNNVALRGNDITIGSSGSNSVIVYGDSFLWGSNTVATRSWVNTQDYMPKSGGTFTGSIFLPSSYVVIGTSTGEQGKNLYVSGNAKVTGTLYIGSATAATQTWVQNQGYITSLSGYATQTWVQQQGYVTSSGVTSVSTSTGLTGGTITSTGTISISSTYQTYISHGESAYNSLSSYLPLSGGTITGNLTVSGKITTNGDVAIGDSGSNNVALRGNDITIGSSGSNSVIVYGDSFLWGSNTVATRSWVNSNFMGLTSGIANCTGVKTDSICIESNETGTGIGNHTGEINRFGKFLHLQYSSTYGITMCVGGGSVLINAITGQQGAKLYVSGNAVITGSCTASSHPTSSDMRMKDFIEYTDVKLEDIAAAPSFLYRWKNSTDTKVYAGSSAQYWQFALPQVVSKAEDQMRSLSLQYDVAALLSAIAIAKKVVNHEERIAQLEEENAALREEIENLKAA